MSDTEEVILTRSQKKDTKPEIAREKLKAKRERLKKEKEDFIIEEAKKRLLSETERKQQEEIQAKQQEEDKKKSDPMFQMLMKMEQMMSKMNEKHLPVVVPGVLDDFRGSKKPRAKKVIYPEPEEEEEVKVKKPVVRKKKEVVADKPNPSKGLPKPRKKVVHLQQEPVQEESTQFVGYDVAPPAQPIQYQPSNGLLASLMSRRNMNSFVGDMNY